MKRVVSLLFALVFCFSSISASAYEEKTNSISRNGILSDGTSIYDEAYSEMDIREEEISSRVLIGYEYVPGYEQIKNRKIEYMYAYLWGTSINFVEGASPTYKVMTRRQTVKETSWGLTGELEGEFNIAAVKANLRAAGDYEEVDIAVIEVGEEWNCDFTEPKLYDLTWYMRGHKYTAYCGGKYISTDGNDGKFTLVNIGQVIFPTKEVHLEITG